MTQTGPASADSKPKFSVGVTRPLTAWLQEPTGRRTILLVQIIVSVALLAWLIRAVDQRTWSAIQDIGVQSLAVVTVVFGTSQVFSGLRLSFLLSYPKPWRVAIVSTFVSFFWSNFLPGTIGGDVVRIARLKAAGIGLAHASGAIVVDRLLNSLGIALLLTVTSAGLGFAWAMAHPAMFALLLLVGGLAGAAGALSIKWALRETFPPALSAFLAPLRTILTDHCRLLSVACLTLCNIGASIVAQYTLSRMLGLEVSLLTLTSIICLVALATMLPISLNGIGVQEVSFVYLLTMVGAEQDKAILYSLLVRGIIFGTSLIAGLVAIADRVFPGMAPPVVTKNPALPSAS